MAGKHEGGLPAASGSATAASINGAAENVYGGRRSGEEVRGDVVGALTELAASSAGMLQRPRTDHPAKRAMPAFCAVLPFHLPPTAPGCGDAVAAALCWGVARVQLARNQVRGAAAARSVHYSDMSLHALADYGYLEGLGLTLHSVPVAGALRTLVTVRPTLQMYSRPGSAAAVAAAAGVGGGVAAAAPVPASALDATALSAKSGGGGGGGDDSMTAPPQSQGGAAQAWFWDGDAGSNRMQFVLLMALDLQLLAAHLVAGLDGASPVAAGRGGSDRRPDATRDAMRAAAVCAATSAPTAVQYLVAAHGFMTQSVRVRPLKERLEEEATGRKSHLSVAEGVLYNGGLTVALADGTLHELLPAMQARLLAYRAAAAAAAPTGAATVAAWPEDLLAGAAWSSSSSSSSAVDTSAVSATSTTTAAARRRAAASSNVSTSAVAVTPAAPPAAKSRSTGGAARSRGASAGAAASGGGGGRGRSGARASAAAAAAGTTAVNSSGGGDGGGAGGGDDGGDGTAAAAAAGAAALVLAAETVAAEAMPADGSAHGEGSGNSGGGVSHFARGGGFHHMTYVAAGGGGVGVGAGGGGGSSGADAGGDLDAGNNSMMLDSSFVRERSSMMLLPGLASPEPVMRGHAGVHDLLPDANLYGDASFSMDVAPFSPPAAIAMSAARRRPASASRRIAECGGSAVRTLLGSSARHYGATGAVPPPAPQAAPPPAPHSAMAGGGGGGMGVSAPAASPTAPTRGRLAASPPASSGGRGRRQVVVEEDEEAEGREGGAVGINDTSISLNHTSSMLLQGAHETPYFARRGGSRLAMSTGGAHSTSLLSAHAHHTRHPASDASGSPPPAKSRLALSPGAPHLAGGHLPLPTTTSMPPMTPGIFRNGGEDELDGGETAAVAAAAAAAAADEGGVVGGDEEGGNAAVDMTAGALPSPVKTVDGGAPAVSATPRATRHSTPRPAATAAAAAAGGAPAGGGALKRGGGRPGSARVPAVALPHGGDGGGEDDGVAADMLGELEDASTLGGGCGEAALAEAREWSRCLHNPLAAIVPAAGCGPTAAAAVGLLGRAPAAAMAPLVDLYAAYRDGTLEGRVLLDTMAAHAAAVAEWHLAHMRVRGWEGCAAGGLALLLAGVSTAWARNRRPAAAAASAAATPVAAPPVTPAAAAGGGHFLVAGPRGSGGGATTQRAAGASTVTPRAGGSAGGKKSAAAAAAAAIIAATVSAAPPAVAAGTPPTAARRTPKSRASGRTTPAGAAGDVSMAVAGDAADALYERSGVPAPSLQARSARQRSRAAAAAAAVGAAGSAAASPAAAAASPSAPFSRGMPLALVGAVAVPAAYDAVISRALAAHRASRKWRGRREGGGGWPPRAAPRGRGRRRRGPRQCQRQPVCCCSHPAVAVAAGWWWRR